MKTDQKLNMTMLCDFYELTMGNGYLKAGFQDRITYFDVYFRSVPDGGGYAIAAGLDQLIDYIEDLHFDQQDIDYLRGRGIFCEKFLDYLANFHFSGDIYAVPEGTPVFPKEPMVVVRAPAIEAQLLETFALLTVNHQSLIATKANRIVRAAKGHAVMEFGSRRAQGSAAAIDGARAAYIAGCCGTACTISDQLYGTPALGTMAHAWVQMFDTEYDAFATYCKYYPQNAVLLVDTYNTLKSGIPNAIKAFNDVLKPLGIKKCGIRLDSGDIAYLSRKARKMLDEAGWTECTITVSNSLDEYLIQDLWIRQRTDISTWQKAVRSSWMKSARCLLTYSPCSLECCRRIPIPLSAATGSGWQTCGLWRQRMKIWNGPSRKDDFGKTCTTVWQRWKSAQPGDQEDLISIGTIGLMKAVDTFDTTRKARFATYASRCIENAILTPANAGLRIGTIRFRAGAAAFVILRVYREGGPVDFILR